MSFPYWERGLKSARLIPVLEKIDVVPLLGTWIEIGTEDMNNGICCVVPLLGTWIEITWH